jgi:hypothetical protein
MVKIPLPVLILQHPQEPSRKDQEAGSASIILSRISPSHLSRGLSWRNLGHALKGFQEIEGIEELKRPALWHTLYLGTRNESAVSPSSLPGIHYLDKKGSPIAPPENAEVGGLILLDGTWAQAKTLWWRNPWLTKTKRIFIVPRSRSLYGNVRKEPRPECVSTVEALAETLGFLGFEPEIPEMLRNEFATRLKEFKGRKLSGDDPGSAAF